MALKNWLPLKRLLFLERERMENLQQIANLIGDVDYLERAVMEARYERDKALMLAHDYANQLRSLETQIEIDALCADVEGEV